MTSCSLNDKSESGLPKSCGNYTVRVSKADPVVKGRIPTVILRLLGPLYAVTWGLHVYTISFLGYLVCKGDARGKTTSVTLIIAYLALLGTWLTNI